MNGRSRLLLVSIDVVIPTAGSPSNLDSIANLQLPDGVAVNFLVVTDGHPGLLDAHYPNLKVIKNTGVGAHSARNTGLDAGSSDYVLFMDDDVNPSPDILLRYRDAIKASPSSIGFIGLVRFPKPDNAFERGAVASDILTFFDIARTRNEFTWGVTANLMVRRDAVGPVRFSAEFPRHGGGEDIDFCLRIVQKIGGRFLTAPEAMVDHAWWQRGARQYRRFARWAYGDSRLPGLHKRYRYWNFPNMVEAATIGVLVCLIGGVLDPRLALGAGWAVIIALLIELVGETTKAVQRKRGSLRTGAEAASVRLSNELGRLAGNLRRGHLNGICERFDYFTTGESISYERKVAAFEFVTFAGLLILTLLL